MHLAPSCFTALCAGSLWASLSSPFGYFLLLMAKLRSFPPVVHCICYSTHLPIGGHNSDLSLSPSGYLPNKACEGLHFFNLLLASAHIYFSPRLLELKGACNEIWLLCFIDEKTKTKKGEMIGFSVLGLESVAPAQSLWVCF